MFVITQLFCKNPTLKLSSTDKIINPSNKMQPIKYKDTIENVAPKKRLKGVGFVLLIIFSAIVEIIE